MATFSVFICFSNIEYCSIKDTAEQKINTEQLYDTLMNRSKLEKSQFFVKSILFHNEKIKQRVQLLYKLAWITSEDSVCDTSERISEHSFHDIQSQIEKMVAYYQYLLSSAKQKILTFDIGFEYHGMSTRLFDLNCHTLS